MSMRFIDLFAGLGGFHLALRQLGHQCVFASEIDPVLRELYEENFGIKPEGDIREVDITKIPRHDILCAGFPCQPFSKAGRQDGLNDPKLGELYKEILKVIKHHHPKFLILENVPNFEMHDDKQTWKHIKGLLEQQEYTVLIKKLSPHWFGIPQIRERVYIVGSTESLDGFEWPCPKNKNQSMNIENYLAQNPENARKIPDNVNDCFDVWQEFLDHVPSDEKIPHPLWSMEFGATYPYKKTTPSRMSFYRLKRYRGSHGQPLSLATNLQHLFKLLPSHARRNQNTFPIWKIKYIQKNREFYERHQSWLDEWVPKIKKFAPSLQKLEWNCQGEKLRNIRQYIIQIRPSGVRVKRRTTIPSLVAMTSTQVPIIAWENRYVTLTECMRLQSMDGPYGLKLLPEQDYKAYEALGNAVNVKVAMLVANALVGEEKQPRDYIYDTEQLTISIEMLSKKRKMAQSKYVGN
jgi:DNA (cytosine-5)-methyltransferase 1